MSAHSLVAARPGIDSGWRRMSRLRAVSLALAGSLLVAGVLYFTGAIDPWVSIGLAGADPARAAPPPKAAEENAPDGLPDHVELSPQKLAVAKITAHPLAMHRLQPARTVPGRLVFNAEKRLEITAPVDAVVKDVLVAPGRSVKRGDRLAVLTSSVIGLARDEVLRSESDAQLAQRESHRAAEIDANIAALLDLLDQRPALKDVETEFKERSLGDDREKLLGAYSKLLLAEAVVHDVATLTGAGALSNRMAQQRTSEREVASAAFLAACERAKFSSRQDRDRTQAAADRAERLLKVRREHVQTLLGRYAEPASSSDGAMSELIMVAPFDARIDERFAVPNQRIIAGERLFLMSDSSSLWVSAEVRETEWDSLGDAVGKSLAVRCPAIPDEKFSAQVKYIGSEVALDTRALPLMAELDNKAGRFRPGMFVWIEIPLQDSREAHALPSSSVMSYEQASFVFVQEKPGYYRRVPTTSGLEVDGWVEVASSPGLPLGSLVVDEGAFLLKSELLLDRAGDD